jgi:hypothetical protein
MISASGFDEVAIEAALAELAAADVVAFGGVGFAGEVLPPTAAYRAIEAALPEQATALRPRLVGLLSAPGPAGRVYAAALLTALDPAAGREAWITLRDAPDADAGFTTFTGCVMRRTTLREYARRQLDRLID